MATKRASAIRPAITSVDHIVISSFGGSSSSNAGLGDQDTLPLIGAAVLARNIPHGGDAPDLTSAAMALALVAGTRGNDSLFGTAGPDMICGRSGNDTLQGLAGEDSLLGGSGADQLYGGDDDDQLAGGSGNDVLCGLAGNDSLLGGSGADQLHGGDGDDTAAGGSGNDDLTGGDGADRLVGESGNDTVAGGDSADTLQGSSGNDHLAGDGDNDRLEGGSGNDGLNGGDGSDSLAGATGADSLSGGDGNDTLAGDAGDDAIDGGAGADKAVFAGKIADYEIATVGGVTTVTDLKPFANGNDGTDTLTTVEQLQFADGVVTIPSGLSFIDLAALTPSQGFVIYGADAGDSAGIGVGSAGDVNGDGFDDLIIGAQFADAADNAKGDAGESYVIFGTGAGFPASLDLAALTPSQGFVIYGADPVDYAGYSVGAADVNGDGFDDLIVGAIGGDAADNAKRLAGETYVIFVTASGFGPSLDLAALTPDQGFVIHGKDVLDFSGYSVGSAGDVNGDGFDDLIVDASRADGAGNAKSYAGETYVIFGTDSGFGPSLDLAALTPGQGVVIYGADVNDRSAFSVRSAGDVNGDGFDDLVIGAYRGDAAGNAKIDAGESYVIFGTDAGFGASLDLATLTAAQGLTIYGADAYDTSGISVSSAGDVNGDGFDDIIIGAGGADGEGNVKSDAGESYLIFGTDAGFGGSLDLAALTAAQGFVIYGASAGDNAGGSVSSAGDVNGDGFDDLIVCAPGADSVDDARSGAGECYVIFGADAGFGASLDLAALTPDQGFVIYGVDAVDRLGWSVSSAGDVDGDGFDDLIVGTFGADAAGNAKSYAGESYVIFGADFTGGIVFAGTGGAGLPDRHRRS